MPGLSESEAKGSQALDFREANAIPEVEMQQYARASPEVDKIWEFIYNDD
jgi:hypothetical protein